MVSFPFGLPGTHWEKSPATCRANSASLFPPETLDARPCTSIEQQCLLLGSLPCAGQGKMAINSLAEEIPLAF